MPAPSNRSHLLKLGAVATVLVVLLAVVYWPTARPVPGTRLDATQIRALPDRDVVERVLNRLSLRAGAGLDGWRRLPEAGRHIYVVRACTVATAHFRLIEQVTASTAFAGSPSLTEMATAFRAIGASAVAQILDDADARVRSSGEAVQAWSAHLSHPDAATPPADPLADQDTRLHVALSSNPIDSMLITYTRAQANALADP